MKKITLTVAVIATMLASCAKNEVDNVVNTGSNNPINFSNLNDKVSRAANDKGDDYKVYAKSTLGGETDWFINDAVKDDNSVVSGATYYWPASPATVDFYAWAPSTVRANTPTYSPLSLSIDYTVPAGADEDFTIAAPIIDKDKTYGTVNFQFSHMLTKITVDAKLTDALTKAGYSMTFSSASLTVNSTSATIDPTADTPAWTSSNTEKATYNVANVKSYMIMPQTSTGCIVKLVDVIITKGGAEVFKGNMKAYTIAADNVTGNVFAKGSHYKLTLTVDGSAHDDGGAGGGGNEKPVFGDQISFSADVATWTSAADTPLTQP